MNPRDLDVAARHYLGVTANEFLTMVDKGEQLPDHPIIAHMLLMAERVR